MRYSAPAVFATMRLRTAAWVGTIVAAALLLRSLALLRAMHRSHAPWVDPDQYVGHALFLVDQGHGWHAAFKAFTAGKLVKAPLYPFVISLFALVPAWFPLSVAVMQIALGTAAVAGLYVIGREVHSPRAGLIAAGVYAVWLPNVNGVHFFLQEQLHIPLVIIGLALFVRAAARSAPPTRFALAGGALGLAALTRSMPLYYIGPAALLYVALAPDRRVGARQALALLLGFAVVVLPWCVYASAKAGQLILIDNMGSAAFGMTYREVRPEVHTAPPATVLESLLMVWRAATLEPARFLSDRVVDFQRLFRLVGGQALRLGPPAASRTEALALKGLVHTSDVLFALSAVLAPIGLVLARRRREVLLVALWVVLYLGLLVTFAWNGVRYRAPYEPELIVLAAIVVAGGWARPPRIALALALAASLVIGAAIAVSVPDTADARASYGFTEWVRVGNTHRASIVGEAGFNMLTGGRLLNLRLSSASTTPRETPVRVRVFVAGREVDQVTLDADERQLKYVWTRPVAYVELRATFENSQQPAPFLVDVDAPQQ
jgi:4-amino-4-deoxy-L-arabinose transferase-like glycosyltransferase